MCRKAKTNFVVKILRVYTIICILFEFGSWICTSNNRRPVHHIHQTQFFVLQPYIRAFEIAWFELWLFWVIWIYLKYSNQWIHTRARNIQSFVQCLQSSMSSNYPHLDRVWISKWTQDTTRQDTSNETLQQKQNQNPATRQAECSTTWVQPWYRTRKNKAFFHEFCFILFYSEADGNLDANISFKVFQWFLHFAIEKRNIKIYFFSFFKTNYRVSGFVFTSVVFRIIIYFSSYFPPFVCTMHITHAPTLAPVLVATPQRADFINPMGLIAFVV